MNDFTIIDTLSVQNHLNQYNLGSVLHITPLLGGTVNTNYLIKTQTGQWVFTIFEVMSSYIAQQISQLLLFLNHHQFPTSIVQSTLDGNTIVEFQNKPSIIVHYIPGVSPHNPTPKQCYQIGSVLAQLHKLTQAYISPIPNTMNNLWREKTAELFMPEFTSSETKLVKSVLKAQQQLPYEQLPQGIIHFDLFRDNTVFIDETLNGIIDFYYACFDTLLIDLSICIHDWSTDWQDPQYPRLQDNFRALLKGYEFLRPLTSTEQEYLPTMLKISALHFWLARMQSQKKDPNEYKMIFLKEFDY